MRNHIEEQFELVSALDVEVILAGETMSTVPAGMTGVFVLVTK